MKYTLLQSSNFRETSFFGYRDLKEDLADIRKHYATEGTYIYTATIEAKDLDEAYMLSNSIQSAWFQNPDLIDINLNGKEGVRSTSIGDLLLDENNIYWVVAPDGFTELGRMANPAA